MPDLNSLPPSQTPSSRSSPTSHHRASLSPQIPSPLSRSPTSTAPAPVPPTGSPRVPRSPRIERRRSSLLRDWSLNDAGGNASPPGGDPPYHHQRAPSLGELHQELENEQEAQVNRLLAMIRQQQAQIQQSQSQLQQHQQQQQQQESSASASTAPTPTVSTTAAVASSTPGSSCPPSAGGVSRSEPQSQTLQQQQQQQGSAATAMPPPASSLSRQSSSSARRRSRTNSHSQYSHASSPSLRPHDGPDWSLPGMGGGRDEVAFYQAETAMVQRENQMLKIRIRELERLVQGMRVGAGGATGGGESSSAQR